MSHRSFRLRRARRPVARVMAVLTALAGSGAFVLAGATAAHAAITDPFSSVFTANTNGNIQIRGNTVVSCQPAATSCAGALTMTNTPAGNNNNNAFFMNYVNVDSAGGTGIFDSSSATVAIPTGGSVLFAALVWGGDTAAGTSLSSAAFGTGTGTAANATLAGQVQLKVPGSNTYGAVTSSRTSFLSGVTGNYQGYANVTAAVQAAGNGSYTVGNVQTATGTNIQGGWALVVAYANPTDPPRNLTIFAGFGSVASNGVVDIPLSGFQTPATGAVNTTLGAVSYEGDAGSTGDQMQLGDSTSTLQNVTDALHPVANTFTSIISDLGVDNSTRNPDYLNQLGFDAATFNVNSFLTNGQTTADIRLTSANGGETYYPGIVTFATDLYAPALSLTKTVAIVTKAAGNTQAGIAEAGDTLQYTLNANNSGVDQSDATVLTDTAPTGTTYKTGSLTSGGTALTDGTGDDVGNFNIGTKQITVDVGTGATSAAGGVVAPAASISTVTFEVVVNAGLAGGSTITNTAVLSYVGHQTSIAFTESSNAVSTPVPNSAPIANADAPTTTANTPVTVNVLANDTDANADALTITSTTVPAHGTDSVVAGQILYTPTTGYSGTDSFSYTISDGHGGTSTATVTVTVTALPVVPPVSPVVSVVPVATPVARTVTVTARAVATAATTVTVATGTGSVSVNPAATVIGHGALTIASLTQPTSNAVVTVVDGKFVITPAAGFVGTTTFTYVVIGADGTRDTVIVTAHVLGETLTLPFTGSDVGSLGLVGLLLVVAGMGALWLARLGRRSKALS